jgi:hypothetical protein
MTTENPRVPIGERCSPEIYRPTPLQYFIGVCWGVLLVLCVCAEALTTMLG